MRLMYWRTLQDKIKFDERKDKNEYDLNRKYGSNGVGVGPDWMIELKNDDSDAMLPDYIEYNEKGVLTTVYNVKSDFEIIEEKIT